jgi:hypothetical protein
MEPMLILTGAKNEDAADVALAACHILVYLSRRDMVLGEG